MFKPSKISNACLGVLEIRMFRKGATVGLHLGSLVNILL